MIETSSSNSYIELAADIVSAYVSNNSVPASDLPSLISDVHSALLRVTSGTIAAATETPKPAVPAKKSITREYLVCLEDGRKFKLLKRHLRTKYRLNEYREQRGLAPDYPMVAPDYAKARSNCNKWALANNAGVNGRRVELDSPLHGREARVPLRDHDKLGHGATAQGRTGDERVTLVVAGGRDWGVRCWSRNRDLCRPYLRNCLRSDGAAAKPRLADPVSSFAHGAFLKSPIPLTKCENSGRNQMLTPSWQLA